MQLKRICKNLLPPVPSTRSAPAAAPDRCALAKPVPRTPPAPVRRHRGPRAIGPPCRTSASGASTGRQRDRTVATTSSAVGATRSRPYAAPAPRYSSAVRRRLRSVIRSASSITMTWPTSQRRAHGRSANQLPHFVDTDRQQLGAHQGDVWMRTGQRRTAGGALPATSLSWTAALPRGLRGDGHRGEAPHSIVLNQEAGEQPGDSWHAVRAPLRAAASRRPPPDRSVFSAHTPSRDRLTPASPAVNAVTGQLCHLLLTRWRAAELTKPSSSGHGCFGTSRWNRRHRINRANTRYLTKEQK